MNSGFDRLQDLETQIQAMSRTESPVELFKVLRDASQMAAPRGSVFLVRQGQLKGWAGFGYDPKVIETLRKFSCGIGEGWLGALAGAKDATSAARSEHESGPDFGQPNAAEAVGSVVRIQGKPVAVVLAERDANETPWHPEANGMLVTMAQLRLELDLALRKMASVQQTPQPEPKTVAAPEPAPLEMTPEPSAPAETTAPEPAATVEPTASSATTEATGLAPAPEAPEGQEQPELEAARRYARLVATDIRLYNEEAVVLGRRNGDLDRRLEEHLDRGKETFLRRHSDLGPTGLDLLHEAYVQVLAAGDDSLIPPSVLA